jgi:hypothetical protein
LRNRVLPNTLTLRAAAGAIESATSRETSREQLLMNIVGWMDTPAACPFVEGHSFRGFLASERVTTMFQSVAQRTPEKLGPSPLRLLTRPMEGFLVFRNVLTPQVIHIVFWFSLAYCIISGFTITVMGLVSNALLLMLAGVLLLALGPIMVRIVCELILVIFNINDLLMQARSATRTAETGVAPIP